MVRTVLAMSGGVDSSVAAQLLIDAGHDVVGVFMRHGNESPLAACSATVAQADSKTNSPNAKPPPEGTQRDALSLPVISGQRLDHKQGCCSARDAEDARQVADRLGIPFYALNLQQEFDRIIDYFVDEYSSGRTPNPCVMCNNWIKFGKLFAYADSLNADFVATGHYAQLVSVEGEDHPRITRGVDASKDQSYVLFGIQRQFVSRMLLPVGGFQKSEIRARAGDLGLRVAEKKDSQEICFVTSGKHADFVAERLGVANAPGDIVDTAGNVLGTHDGIEQFTIGQRRGLRVALGEPRFVVRIEPETRRVVIGEKHELGRTKLTAANANWLMQPSDEPFSCSVQIRYNSSAQPATVTVLDEGRFSVVFDEPCNGVAPGQAAVCYNGGTVLGGGWIE